MPESGKNWVSDQMAAAMQVTVHQVLDGQVPVPRSRPTAFPDDWQQNIILGKTDASHALDATGTVSIYGKLGETIGSETDTGDNLTDVYNRFASLAADAWVYVLPSVGANGFDIIGGGGGCIAQNTIIDITVGGSPTGGTFDIGLTVNSSNETLQFNWDDDNGEVETELETHTEIAAGSPGDVIVTAGPFPDAVIRIEFVDNLANTDILLPTIDFGSLTGGAGVFVIAAKSQLGVG